MTDRGPLRTRLRRFTASQVMRVLALLVALLLPLHGIANAFSSIQSPAHFHLPSTAGAVHTRVAYVDSEASENKTGHDILGGSHNHDHDAQVDEHDHDDPVGHHDQEHQGDSTIGHHAHALDASDVVYMGSDLDRAEQGAVGKHVATSGEAPLPAWSMPSLATFDGQLLPESASAFRSLRARPLLRPPSRVAAFAA